MDYNKLLSLLESPHVAYQCEVASASRTYDEWARNATDGFNAEVLYADERRNEAIRLAYATYQAGEPIPNPALGGNTDPDIRWYHGECDAANDEYEDRYAAANSHKRETLSYAYQWHTAALNGAAQDFNLALIRAMDEAAKPQKEERS